MFPRYSEPYIYLSIGLASGFVLGVTLLKNSSRRYYRTSLLQVIRNVVGSTDAASSQIQKSARMVNEELKMVFVVRTDLKMGVGKIGAQCGHAAVVNYELTAERAPHYLVAWRERGQVKITLKGESEEHLHILQATAESLGLVAEIIHDAGRTQIAAGTATVLGIGPAPRSIVDQVTGSLKLMH